MHTASRSLIALVLLVLAPVVAGAQATGAISGSTVDASTGQPLADVRVTVLAAADSAAVGAAGSAANGAFRVDGVPLGSYLVSLDRIGYARTVVRAQVTAAGAAALDLGTVRLSPAVISMEGVVVTAAPPAVVFAPDRDIYSVAAIPGAEGATVTEVLTKIPEVEVDANGGITLRGQRPQVYINGRPAPMKGEALDAFLADYGAENVENVEVMANPSARYEAEGAGGIVNIVLRRDARLGTNGNVSLNAGTRGESGINGRATHNDGDLTITGGSSLRLNRTDSFTSQLRQYLDAEPIAYLQQDASNERLSWSGNVDLSAEYRLAAKTTVSMEGSVHRNMGDSDRATDFTEMDTEMDVLDEYDRVTNSESAGLSTDVALQAEHEFATRGHEISVEVEYGAGGDRSESLIRRRLEEELSPDLERLFEVTTDDARESQRELGFGIDYARPLGRIATVELGYDGTLTRDDDERVRLIGVDGTPLEAFDERSSGFLHTQALNSFYLTTNGRFGDLNAQLGLRAEHSSATYDRSEADVFEHSYLTLFPSGNLSYNLGQGKRLRLSYSLRTRRPTANVVDPADRSNDPMNRQVGNPDIDPQLTHSMSLDASWSGQLGTLRIAPSYQRTVDEWAQLKTVDGAGVSTTTWGNFASTSSLGTSLTLQARDVKGVSGSVSLTGQREHRDYNEVIDRAARTTTRWSVRTNLSGRLTDMTNVSGSLSYNPPREGLQGRTSGSVMTSLSMRQRLLDGRASLNLSLTDPLGLVKTSSSTLGRGFVELGREQATSRRASLSFSYNFGTGARRAGGGGARGGAPAGGAARGGGGGGGR